MIQVSIYQYLLEQVALVAEVGDRIYPAGGAPTPTARPYITWQIIDDSPTHVQGGATGLHNPRFQFDVWADSEYDAARIFTILRKALDVFRGEMGDTVLTTVRSIELESSREEYLPPDDATEEGVHRASGDFLVYCLQEV